MMDMFGRFKSIFIVAIVVNLAACQSTTNMETSAKAESETESYIRRINKSLLSNNQSYVRDPEVVTIRIPGSVITHSSVCGVNDFATDGRKVKFLWKRYCNAAEGNFEEGTCTNSDNEVLFQNVTEIDKTCVIGHRDNISHRKITIIEPSDSRTNPRYLAELKKLGYRGLSQ